MTLWSTYKYAGKVMSIVFVWDKIILKINSLWQNGWLTDVIKQKKNYENLWPVHEG